MTKRRALGLAILAAAIAPAAWLGWRAVAGDLGANPIETVEHATGDWALRFLLAALAVTPLHRIAGFRALAAYRRRLGLAAFAWVTAHFLTWSVLDNGLDARALAEDIGKRPYVTVGFTAFALLVPLAVTSTRGWIRRLGARWVALHRLVYVAAALAITHYLWLVKKDLRPPLAYAGVLLVLLGARGFLLWRGARRRAPSRSRPWRPAGPPL